MRRPFFEYGLSNQLDPLHWVVLPDKYLSNGAANHQRSG